MGFIVNKNDGGGGDLGGILGTGQKEDGQKRESEARGERGLVVDTDPLRCETCRRELLPWQTECPDDGGQGVPSEELPTKEDELLERFLRNEEQGTLPEPSSLRSDDDVA